VILDTSALLAVLFGEPRGAEMTEIMQSSRALAMSTVNLCETLVVAADRRRVAVADVADLVQGFAIEQVPPDEQTATLAAIARLSLPLNFGDCFAYALAKIRDQPLLTLDTDFARTDVELAETRKRNRPRKP
jgi:ribonuclease VapC